MMSLVNGLREALLRRPERVVFLVVMAVTFLSITRGMRADNIGARAAIMLSIVQRGTLNIDPYVDDGSTGDWSRWDGHYYSNKAPGPAFLALPVYFVQHQLRVLTGATDHDADPARDAAVNLASAFVTVLPTLIALWFFWETAERRLRLRPPAAFALTATWAAASISFPNTVMFFGHQTGVAFFAIGMCVSLLEQDARPLAPRASRLFAAGLSMGIAVTCDYMSAVLVVVWGAWLTWQRPRAVIPWLLGGAGPALFLMTYHWACFGSPLRTPYSLEVLDPRFTALATWEWPSVQRLILVTVNPHRGLFYTTPVYALMLVSLERIRAHVKQWPELLPALVGVVGYLLILSAWPSYYGGACIGPRYFVAALPFATLLLAPAVTLLPRVFTALAILSAAKMLVMTVVDPLPPPEVGDPFWGWVMPLLANDRPTLMYTVFEGLGLPLVGAVLCYAALWTVAGLWVARRTLREVAS